jgi:hypothetical protein
LLVRSIQLVHKIKHITKQTREIRNHTLERNYTMSILCKAFQRLLSVLCRKNNLPIYELSGSYLRNIRVLLVCKQTIDEWPR